MVTRIEHEGELIALLADNRDIVPGTHPITDSANVLQMLMMSRPAGHVFSKHTHKSLARETQTLQEAVVVTEGVLAVTVCTRDGNDLGTWNVGVGQCLYLVNGGYKIEVAEDARFFEFKNGPHIEDDKVEL